MRVFCSDDVIININLRERKIVILKSPKNWIKYQNINPSSLCPNPYPQKIQLNWNKSSPHLPPVLQPMGLFLCRTTTNTQSRIILLIHKHKIIYCSLEIICCLCLVVISSSWFITCLFQNLCVCVCACTCMCMVHVCAYACAYVCMRVRMCARLCVCICLCVNSVTWLALCRPWRDPNPKLPSLASS